MNSCRRSWWTRRGSSPSRRAIGEDYIIKAFEFAHAADPAAELYYNDFNIGQAGKLGKTIRLINELKAGGARIDAVGIQGHWLIDYPVKNRTNHPLPFDRKFRPKPAFDAVVKALKSANPQPRRPATGQGR